MKADRPRAPKSDSFAAPVIAAAAVVALLSAISAQPAIAAAVGERAPACQLRTLAGTGFVDLDRFRGKVVYVDFWASWCAPCAKSFSFLNALDREFRDRGLQVVGVGVDENLEDARAFLARHPASFEIGSDPSGKCPESFGVPGMPTSYLIDREGVIREMHIGFRGGEAAARRQAIERLLSPTPAVTGDAPR